MSLRRGVAVIGAAGRMGTRLTRLLGEHPTLQLDVAIERESADPASALGGVAVVIDFSAPAACRELAPLCAARGVAYVVGSTGLTAEHHRALDEAARRVPVLQAANFSLGVNVLLELVGTAAARLGAGEVGIHDVHHRHKQDAPSGTALALEAAAKQARPSAVVQHTALRGGDVAGEHTVTFFADGERLELTHRAATPDIFARGALAAAAWLIGKPAGRYEMADVLRGA